MITWRPIISGSTGTIFTIFSPHGRYLFADYQSGRLFQFLKRSYHGNQTWENFGANVHSAQRYSKIDSNIAMPIQKYSMAIF